MLEVSHLKKVYKIKNQEDVYALNDVSLKFPEKGLVFILGKSGSGKSTLLNLMGGLDKPDAGEIIINGKSSRNFSGSEMDSYRNTYLGFIFQEYNILNDFTVKENIALALQLQHKKATDEEIMKILKEVDLIAPGIEKRKPNELSGGQKQRVAIARALVKDPKIIFGDEPTGALDSNTGKQVFETLKKLSKDKLVVIVSHDRDFAEHFGDRVIELKDGKVISDITKTMVETKSPASGISLVGDNVIRLDKNHLLTVEDLAIINETISKSEGEVYISADSHVNDSLLEAAKIDKSGNREEFVKTDASKIVSSDDEFHAIPSKFSLGRAFRMGAKSLKVKPFRLTMTCLLSIVAFTLFGASATLAMFNKKDAFLSNFDNDPVNLVRIDGYTKTDDSNFGSRDIDFEKQKEEIEKELGLKVLPVYSDSAVELPYISSSTADLFQNVYYSSAMGNKVYTTDGFLNDTGFELVAGKLPEKEGDCLLTAYQAEGLTKFGFVKDKNTSFAKGEATYDDLIGLSLSDRHLDSGSYTVTGVIDTFVSPRFDSYKDIERNQLADTNHVYSELISSQPSWYHNDLFCYPESKSGSQDVEYGTSYLYNKTENKEDSMMFRLGYFPSHENVIYFDSGKTELNKGEILISPYTLNAFGSGSSSKTVSITFDGAYTSADGNELYNCETDLKSVDDQIQNACMYKVAYDCYEDFYKNHLDEIKVINENKDPERYHFTLVGSVSPSSWDEEHNPIYDYRTMSDEAKFNFLCLYLSCNRNSSNFYHAQFEEAMNHYQQEFYPLFDDMDIADVRDVYLNLRNSTQDAYIEDNYESFYEEHKNEDDYKEVCLYFVDPDGFDVNHITDNVKKQVLNDFYYRDKNIVSEIRKLTGEKLRKVLSYYNVNLDIPPLHVSANYNYMESLEFDFKIVGLDLDNEDYSQTLGISSQDKDVVQAVEDKYSQILPDAYSGLVCVGKDRASYEKFLDYYAAHHFNDVSKMKEGDVQLYLKDYSLSNIEGTSSLILILTQVFLSVGAALAVFALLLFYNFISISINNKKREIGILRAVGAKRSDVFKIFFSEAFIIAGINFVFSTILTFVLSFVMNRIMAESAYLTFHLMNPNVLIVLLLLGLCLFGSFLSSILPVTKIANKKPIDAIHNK